MAPQCRLALTVAATRRSCGSSPPPALLVHAPSQGRVAFTGVSHEQQRVQKHQQLRQARLEQLEAARRAAEDAASRRKQAAKTAQTEATVEHLAETAASHMTSSVNEALATYCAFEELPMYTPAQRGVDGRVALGYTFPGMPVSAATPPAPWRPLT